MATKYRCIVIDPPWNERGCGKCKRGADKYYSLLRTKDMPGVIRESGVWTPAATCHLYLWTTNNFLKDGLWLMEELGFRYITVLTWTKHAYGLGYYYRGQTEQCLFGVRGRLPALARTESTALLAPRTKHSRKPDAMYEKIMRVSPGPRLEMFARGSRVGWDVWGNEADKFPAQPTLIDEVAA